MDNSVNSNLSFQAKLVTKIKGRNNIMQPVAKEFEKLTKKIPGEFHVDRFIDNYAKHYAELEYKSVSMITTSLFDMISKESVNPKDVAKRLANTLRAMMAEVSYNKKVEPVLDAIDKQKQNIRRAKYELFRAETLGLDNVADVVKHSIESYKEKVSGLNAKILELQESACKKMDKYRDKGFDVGPYMDCFKGSDIIL